MKLSSCSSSVHLANTSVQVVRVQSRPLTSVQVGWTSGHSISPEFCSHLLAPRVIQGPGGEPTSIAPSLCWPWVLEPPERVKRKSGPQVLSAGGPGPQSGHRKTNESWTFPFRGGNSASTLSRILAPARNLETGAFYRRGGPGGGGRSFLFDPPTPTQFGSSGHGRSR